MKKTILVDTNIVIRLLLNDNIELVNKAKSLFSKAQQGLYLIYLDEVILAEVVWTLSSYYKFEKVNIVDRLEKLIFQDWIVNPRKKLMIRALGLFGKINLSYIDCWIFTVNQNLKTSLETFDDDLKKLRE